MNHFDRFHLLLRRLFFVDIVQEVEKVLVHSTGPRDASLLFAKAEFLLKAANQFLILCCAMHNQQQNQASQLQNMPLGQTQFKLSTQRSQTRIINRMYSQQISSFYSMKLQKMLTDPFPQSYSFTKVKNQKQEFVPAKPPDGQLISFEKMKTELLDGLRARDRLYKAIKDEKGKLVQNRLDLYKEQKVSESRRKIERIKEVARGELSSKNTELDES